MSTGLLECLPSLILLLLHPGFCFLHLVAVLLQLKQETVRAGCLGSSGKVFSKDNSRQCFWASALTPDSPELCFASAPNTPGNCAS